VAQGIAEQNSGGSGAVAASWLKPSHILLSVRNDRSCSQYYMIALHRSPSNSVAGCQCCCSAECFRQSTSAGQCSSGVAGQCTATTLIWLAVAVISCTGGAFHVNHPQGLVSAVGSIAGWGRCKQPIGMAVNPTRTTPHVFGTQMACAACGLWCRCCPACRLRDRWMHRDWCLAWAPSAATAA
jgi:hypothetical protein